MLGLRRRATGTSAERPSHPRSRDSGRGASGWAWGADICRRNGSAGDDRGQGRDQPHLLTPLAHADSHPRGCRGPGVPGAEPRALPSAGKWGGGAKTLSGPALSYLSKAVVPHARLPPPNFAAALAQAGPHCCGLTTPPP